jgi:hypothetical protein
MPRAQDAGDESSSGSPVIMSSQDDRCLASSREADRASDTIFWKTGSQRPSIDKPASRRPGRRPRRTARPRLAQVWPSGRRRRLSPPAPLQGKQQVPADKPPLHQTAAAMGQQMRAASATPRQQRDDGPPVSAPTRRRSGRTVLPPSARSRAPTAPAAAAATAGAAIPRPSAAVPFAVPADARIRDPRRPATACRRAIRRHAVAGHRADWSDRLTSGAGAEAAPREGGGRRRRRRRAREGTLVRKPWGRGVHVWNVEVDGANDGRLPWLPPHER